MLGDVLAAALPGLRAEAVSRMTERGYFFEWVPGFDPVTLLETEVERVVGVPTVARLRSDNRSAGEVVVGTQVPAVSTLVLSVPVGSVLVGKGLFFRVTDSSSDAGLVGVVVRTLFEPTLGQVTAWRYPVEAVSRGV